MTDAIDLKPGNTKPKSERIPPDPTARMTGKEEPFAYTLKDAAVGDLDVLNSSNAWWLDRGKVLRLIEAYKFFATDLQACFHAGISLDQLKYFQELHPQFYAIKEACKQAPGLRAKRTVVEKLAQDANIAWNWLERTEKETFSPRSEVTGAGGRDIMERVTEDVRALGEALRTHDDGKTEKHTGGAATGKPDAGSDGAGHAPAAPGTTGEDSVVSS